MGSRRHPLDIFRSTDDGFDHASRRRRTVVGKVLQSKVRSGRDAKAPSSSERAAGLLGSWKRGERKRKPARPVSPAAARAEAAGRKVLYGVVGLAVVVALGFSLRSAFIDEPGGVPHLAADKVLGTRPAAQGLHAVRAASYGANEDALRLAWAAHDELLARGFEDVLVIEVPDGAGGLGGYELLVGRASAAGLVQVQRDLRAIDDWPGGAARPFSEASLRRYPSLDD